MLFGSGGGGGAVVRTYVGNAPEEQEGTFEQRIECNFTVGAVIFGGIRTDLNSSLDRTKYLHRTCKILSTSVSTEPDLS